MHSTIKVGLQLVKTVRVFRLAARQHAGGATGVDCFSIDGHSEKFPRAVANIHVQAVMMS